MINKVNYLIHYGVKKEYWSPEARAKFDAKHRNKQKNFPEPKTIDGHIYSLYTGRDTTEDIRRAKEKGAVASEYVRLNNNFGQTVARKKHFDEIESNYYAKRREEALEKDRKRRRTKELPDGRVLSSRRRNPNGKTAIYGYNWGKTTPVHDGHYESPSGGKVGNHSAGGLKQAIKKAKQIQASLSNHSNSTSNENLQNGGASSSNAGVGDNVRRAKVKSRRGPKTKNGVGYKIKPKNIKSDAGKVLKKGSGIRLRSSYGRYGGSLASEIIGESAREKYRVKRKKNRK